MPTKAAPDETHDPARQSWVESANAPGADFPIQNLPYGVFSARGSARHIGVAIGDDILDLTRLEDLGMLCPGSGRVFDEGILNPFMKLGPKVWRKTRAAIAKLLDASNPALQGDATLRQNVLIPAADARMHLPFFVRSYTDFYASREHATNVGSMFRDPHNALMPNWLHLPVGYNGRASTVVVSGTDIRRPMGQIMDAGQSAPHFAPSARLDFEVELGAVVGTDSAMGARLSTAQAYEMIFGYVLLNDWSARDIQVWEYQPLGPFQSKAFATSISPWVVTADALEPFRKAAPAREVPLLDYLHEETPNNFDIDLTVDLTPHGGQAHRIAQTNAGALYYSSAQQLAHHASSGCAMCVGDLLGSGTISGSEAGTYGSLLELTWNGRDPLAIGGKPQSFLADHDSVTISGACQGAYRLGFGQVSGRILPAD